MHRNARRVSLTPTLLTAALLALLSLGTAACGDDDDEGATAKPEGTPSTQSGNATDRKFLEDMAPHHAGGVQFGQIAQRRAEHKETKALGQQVEDAQAREIEQMKRAHQRLFGSELALEEEADPAILELETAKPFDRHFYDGLIPHHQDAIKMARAELADGKDPELRRLAESIIQTQSKEIEDMNEWRERFYGASSPAGGVPKEGEEPGSGGGHGSESEPEGGGHSE